MGRKVVTVRGSLPGDRKVVTVLDSSGWEGLDIVQGRGLPLCCDACERVD